MAHGERGDRSTEAEHSFAGYQVYDMHYEKIGKVDDLFVDERDRPEYIGVKTGLLGTKTTLIPIDLVRINDKRQLVEVAADKETVKEAPTFGDDKEITPEFERRVHSYYGVETTQSSAERGAYGEYYPGATGDDEHRVDLRPGERASEARERSDERHPGGAAAGGVDRVRSGERRPGVTAARGGVDRERGRDLEGEDEVRIQRSEEELRARTREREAGGTRLRKRVRTEREQLRVPKKREEVHVERVPVEEEGRGAPKTGGRETSGGEIEEDEIRVPIIEEEVVVEKRPVVKEEIHLRKEVVEDEEVIEEDVRKEEIEIDDQTERRDR